MITHACELRIPRSGSADSINHQQCEVDGHILTATGPAYVGFRRDDGLKDRHKGTLYSMYVTPTYRRGGTGRLLIKGVLAEARQIEGLIQVDLMVVAENEPAVRLYQSLGFETYGREPRALKSGDRYLDEYLMVYFLDGSTLT